jgi:hypothetical protein
MNQPPDLISARVVAVGSNMPVADILPMSVIGLEESMIYSISSTAAARQSSAISIMPGTHSEIFILMARSLMCIRAAKREMRALTNAIIHRFMAILTITLCDILEIDSGYHRT